MSTKFNADSNGDSSRALIAEILDKISSSADLDDLTRYRAFIRKNVPLTMRSWFMTYLFMQIDQAVPGGRSRQDRRSGRDDRSRQSGRPEGRDGRGEKGEGRDRQGGRDQDRNAAQGERGKGRGEPQRGQSQGRQASGDERRKEQVPQEPPRKLDDEVAASIFVSVGRNRRVYARDLYAIFQNVEGVAHDDIGSVRILDNFSFVQVRKEKADEVIAALNGLAFRGRTLAVSYAKPRKEPGARAESASEGDDAGSTASDAGRSSYAEDEALDRASSASESVADDVGVRDGDDGFDRGTDSADEALDDLDEGGADESDGDDSVAEDSGAASGDESFDDEEEDGDSSSDEPEDTTEKN